MADGIQRKLRAGVAALLHASGAATWTASGAVSLTASPPPVFDTFYPDKPDVAAALSTYAAGGDEPTLAGSMLMLQVRTRSSLTDVATGDDLDDAISQVLLGNYPVNLPNGVTISTLIRVSGSSIGRDAAGRMERTTNYRLFVHDPGPHRG
jgi:hypothetical protein